MESLTFSGTWAQIRAPLIPPRAPLIFVRVIVRVLKSMALLCRPMETFISVGPFDGRLFCNYPHYSLELSICFLTSTTYRCSFIELPPADDLNRPPRAARWTSTWRSVPATDLLPFVPFLLECTIGSTMQEVEAPFLYGAKIMYFAPVIVRGRLRLGEIKVASVQPQQLSAGTNSLHPALQDLSDAILANERCVLLEKSTSLIDA